MFRESLSRFLACANDSIGAAYEVLSRVSTLEEIREHLKSTVQGREADLEQAKCALETNLLNKQDANESSDGEIDCSLEYNEVEMRGDELSSAREELDKYECRLRILNRAVSVFLDAQSKFSQLPKNIIPASISTLGQLIDGAEDYISIVPATQKGIERSTSNQETLLKANVRNSTESEVAIGLKLLASRELCRKSGLRYSLDIRRTGSHIEGVVTGGAIHFKCFEMELGLGQAGKCGRLSSFSIPPELQKDLVSAILLDRVEAAASILGADEISIWADAKDHQFLVARGYIKSLCIPGEGGELSKKIKLDFIRHQRGASDAFANHSTSHITIKDSTLVEINPLFILTPPDFASNGFWERHKESIDRYIELLKLDVRYRSLASSGFSDDDLRRLESEVHNAHEVMVRQPVRLERSGGYLRVDQGQHRVAAAQAHYLETGEILPVCSQIIIEYK